MVYGPGREVGSTAGVTLACRNAVEGRPYAIPFTGETDMIFVDDVAAAFEAALLRPVTGAHVFNLRGEVASVEAIIAEIRKLGPAPGSRPRARPCRSSPRSPPMTWPRCWVRCRPPSLAEGLRRTVGFYPGRRPALRHDAAGGSMSDQSTAGPLPFSAAKLDRCMEQAGIDTLVVSSKHNLAYLLGGHRHHFFEVTDAIGVSRYLPLLVYRKGRPDQAAYIANRNEKDAIANRALEGRALWPATIRPAASGVTGRDGPGDRPHPLHRGHRGPDRDREAASCRGTPDRPWPKRFPQHGLADANRPLERLRAVKTAQELDTLREASERVVGAMQAVMRSTQPGTSKRAIERALRREEEERGLIFEYALITIGSSLESCPL